MRVPGGLGRHRGPAALGFVMIVIGFFAAMSVDVPRTGYGIKSDEATYVAAALSLAYDGDLAFQQRDLHRFAGLYHDGPEGIFLKRAPSQRDDPHPSRLYFGKSLAYPVAAAPFVRLLGLNGLLVFHVALLGLFGVTSYLFLAAQSPPLASAAFVTAFVGASVLPAYGVFLMPEIFNVTLVTVAYFLWLYKEVAPQSKLSARWTDFAAAGVLGLCVYSKPLPTPLLMAPLVLLAWHRRQWIHGLAVGVAAVAVAASCFGFNAAVSGDFNYQGGDRKMFYGRFPFDASDPNWERQGGVVATDTSAQRDVITSLDVLSRLSHNATYFLVGRHFGFVPYFFPGVVAIVCWLASPSRRDAWRVLTFASVLLSALALLIVVPWTWNGDGGPIGNRYFLTAYPALIFLMPAVSVAPGVAAWLGGALFTAKILVSPFVLAKHSYLIAERGPARLLPVELTMTNTLPMRLAQPLRGRVPYGNVLLYFLDQNAWPPEPEGMWLSGTGRADIVVRTATPVDRLVFEADSPIPTTLTITLGSDPVTVRLTPGKISYFDVKAAGVRGPGDYNYLMTARSSGAFVPHLRDPRNMDYRNLGAQLRFQAVMQTAALK